MPSGHGGETDEVINAIVDQELAFSHAQLYMWGVGRLDAGGARGGPAAAVDSAPGRGRFDLYDAWIGSHNPKRAQIARGQEMFNNVNVPSGRSCSGCHNAANNGQNVGGAMFNVGTSDGSGARSPTWRSTRCRTRPRSKP